MYIINILFCIIINYIFLFVGNSNYNCCYVQLNQKASIGNKLDLGHEYLFRNPQYLRSDTDGNIFISDKNSSSIKIFDQNYHFKKTVGVKGQGPGEFQEITSFHIDDKNNIVVFDKLSQRFTIFLNSSEYSEFRSFNLDVKFGAFNVSQILNKNDELLMGVLNHTISNGKSLNFIRIFDDHIHSSFQISGSEIADVNEPFEHATLAMSMFNLELVNNILWLSPAYYNGSLFRFNLDTGDLTEHAGHSPLHPPYKYVSDDYISRERNNMSIYNGIAGRFITKIYNKSVGLFFHDGEIIEFVFMDNDASYYKNAITFGINRYSLDGSFIDYHVIDQFSGDPSGRFFLDVLWRDDYGRFYFLDKKDIPFIRIMELEISS